MLRETRDVVSRASERAEKQLLHPKPTCPACGGDLHVCRLGRDCDYWHCGNCTELIGKRSKR